MLYENFSSRFLSNFMLPCNTVSGSFLSSCDLLSHDAQSSTDGNKVYKSDNISMQYSQRSSSAPRSQADDLSGLFSIDLKSIEV